MEVVSRPVGTGSSWKAVPGARAGGGQREQECEEGGNGEGTRAERARRAAERLR